MILILAAMKEEMNAIHSSMENSIEVPFLESVYYKGTICGQEVVLAQTGIGKVSTAMILTSILQSMKIDQILNIGSAGGLGRNQEIGDVVIATQGSFHDRYFTDKPDLSEGNLFHTDDAMRQKLLGSLNDTDIKSHVGVMVSGDQFLSSSTPHYKDVLTYFSTAISVDMESTTVMQVANAFDVPCLIIRSLSDVPGHINHEGQFDEYLEFASKQSATICELYINSL